VKTWRLKTGLFISLFIISAVYPSYAQNSSSQLGESVRLSSSLPSDLMLKENVPQKYRLTTTWYNRDINGKATGKFIINGEYTRALENHLVRWNRVNIQVFENPEASGSDTLFQEWMEGFSYRSPEDIATPDLFRNFPADESAHLLRTLIWDAVAFETFAWTFFDKLSLNKTLTPAEMDDFTVQMADWGTIRMKDLRLTWVGISEMNGETCALIHYESFMNPVRSLGINGRSLYWGMVWVSLEDKQIEYATLNEDVTMEVVASSQSGKFLNIQRDVEFHKIQ
jgi:hypothetical protein